MNGVLYKKLNHKPLSDLFFSNIMMIPLDNSIHSVRSESSSIGRSVRSTTGIDSERDRKKREQKRRKYELKLIKKFDRCNISIDFFIN